MNLAVPVYVEADPGGGAWTVHPLFVPVASVRRRDLPAALARLGRDLRETFDDLRRSERQDALVEAAFCPDLTERRLEVQVRIRKRSVRARLLFVTFEALGGRVGMTPSLAGLWFPVPRGRSLASVAAEVLSAHFTRLEREAPWTEVPDVAGRAWTATLDLEVPLGQPAPEPPGRLLELLSGDPPEDGATALAKVGRRLDDRYPNDLDRPSGRDDLVEELIWLLSEDPPRPVLLLCGPTGVGKTALAKATSSYLFGGEDRLVRPELVNRLDAIVPFSPLSDETLRALTARELHALAAREGLDRRGLTLLASQTLIQRLASEGSDRRYGARPLQRTVEARVVAPLARWLLSHPRVRDRALRLGLSRDGGLSVR